MQRLSFIKFESNILPTLPGEPKWPEGCDEERVHYAPPKGISKESRSHVDAESVYWVEGTGQE